MPMSSESGNQIIYNGEVFDINNLLKELGNKKIIWEIQECFLIFLQLTKAI